jgi:hypothetical protein
MKTILSLLLLISFSNTTVAQTTAIPDAYFEQALINLGYDTGLIDGLVLTSNINTIDSLNITNKHISDLSGIEDFSALIYLKCRNNSLSNLDLTQNSALIILECGFNLLTNINVTHNILLSELNCIGNQLTNLDVTKNAVLNTLNCNFNQLSNLDVTQNLNLVTLRCYDNQINNLNVTQNIALVTLTCSYNELSSLNLSQNDSLTFFTCDKNQLTCLDVKNGTNTSFTHFDARFNPNLTCIKIDDISYSNTNWTNIDPQTSFSTNCGNPCIVGIDDLNENFNNLNFYPNPTSNQLTIDTELKINNIKITDISGKTIKTITSDLNVINVANLSDGIYFIKLITNERTITKKFVKQ